MKIYMTVGRGDGPTPLAAFDNAMYDARVGNYNLVHLSSVIPPYSTIERAPFVGEPKDYGDRLYVVLASQTSLIATRTSMSSCRVSAKLILLPGAVR